MTVTVKVTNIPRKRTRKKVVVKVTKKRKAVLGSVIEQRTNESIVQPGESRTEELTNGDTLKVEEAEETRGKSDEP
jgi:hypothetical protein